MNVIFDVLNRGSYILVLDLRNIILKNSFNFRGDIPQCLYVISVYCHVGFPPNPIYTIVTHVSSFFNQKGS